jgi:hypothetical protein
MFRRARRWSSLAGVSSILDQFHCSGNPIVWVETARYLGITLDKGLTWSSHVEQVRKKASQRLAVLGSLLNGRSGLSTRNGVLRYRKLIRPMMDYACPVWRFAARSHIRKLHVL